MQNWNSKWSWNSKPSWSLNNWRQSWNWRRNWSWMPSWHWSLTDWKRNLRWKNSPKHRNSENRQIRCSHWNRLRSCCSWSSNLRMTCCCSLCSRCFRRLCLRLCLRSARRLCLLFHLLSSPHLKCLRYPRCPRRFRPMRQCHRRHLHRSPHRAMPCKRHRHRWDPRLFRTHNPLRKTPGGRNFSNLPAYMRISDRYCADHRPHNSRKFPTCMR